MLISCMKEYRIKQLKTMHQFMIDIGDEDIYADWILLVPDEPNEEDFDFIAESDGFYDECVDLFTSLLNDAAEQFMRRG